MFQLRSIFPLLILLLVALMPLKLHSQSNEESTGATETISARERIFQLIRAADKQISSSLEEALNNATLAIDLAKEAGEDSLLHAAYATQGNVYLNLASYTKALQAYQVALKGAHTRGDRYMEAVLRANMGSIYYFQRNLERALEYDSTALAYFQETPVDALQDPLRLRYANLLNNIGIIHEEEKRFNKAREYYVRSLEIGEIIGDVTLIANVLNNMGTMYRDQGNPDLALQYYRKALNLRLKAGNPAGIARSYHNLGSYYMTTNTDSAIHYLEMAISSAEPIGAWQTVGSAADNLYKAYADRKDYRRALETLELSRRVNDTLFNRESTKKMAQMELQFELERREATAQAELDRQTLRQWMQIGALLSVIVVIALLYFLQRSKNHRMELLQANLELERSQLQASLETRDKELAANIMNLINKNQLINQISEKLLEIKEIMPANLQSAIHKVILDLQTNLNPELWQEFELRFQQVHENFYRSLTEKFPDLSPNERRLCAFLKLNMTTKEISAITHQSAKTIDVARTRLRKKLNLTGTDQNLVAFLSQLGEPE